MPALAALTQDVIAPASFVCDSLTVVLVRQ